MVRLKRLGVASVVGALLLAGHALSAAQNGGPIDSFPETIDGIHIFNDQIDVHHLTDAQAAFAATHFAGAQKLTLSGTQRLRAYNPQFTVLHYRLGLGLGYRLPDADCQPTGDYLAYIRGDDWVQEWPGDDVVAEDWLYHYAGQRLYWCAWGWYLADIDHPGWRDWWITQIKSELAINDNEGLFADSVSVPNFLGADDWRPALPAYDEAFEADWTRRINDWMAWARDQFGDEYALIVNIGAGVTSRETTDYALADGVMIEGFAGWGEYDRFEVGDWRLQLDRVLTLVNKDRVVILQSYVQDSPERLWVLANYLLVKGAHTYVNLETSQDVEWFPEYDLPIGQPLDAPPQTIAALANEAGLYARSYSNGLVLVNPDPNGSPRTMSLDGTRHLVTGAVGGGDIPADADISGWGVLTVPTAEVTVAPGDAAILLIALPADSPSAPDSAATSPQTQPAGAITAFHRSGQTFLTWPEVAGDPALTYRVFRHSAPLDADTLDQAQLLAEMPQGSGIFWTEHARALEPPFDDGGYRSLETYVITDLGAQLPDGTGLLVWTTHADGEFYYAVATSGGDLIGTTGPVAERVTDPEPILVWQSADGLGRVYTQFMDYATYNPTFDAPRPGNGWLALPNWEQLEQANNHQQYAYNYWVGLPSPDMCDGAVPDQVPLILYLEGWGGRYAAPDRALYWCAVMLWGDDPSQSWHFGFSATHDYRTDAPVTSGPIVNYTESRLLRALHDVIDSLDAPAIDQNRIYVYGHSMGGTGALMFAERYPQLFAAAAASEPMMNFAAAEMWIPELEAKWGARTLNLPVEIRGPDATPLAPYQDTGVWDWQNLGEQLSARRSDDMALIAIAHGTQDTVIDWQTVARPAYSNFYAGRRAFIGEITSDDHTWLGFRYHPNWNFDAMNITRDESLPALSHASGSLPIPPDGTGGYNLSIEWSASGNDFAGPPVDTPAEWRVALRSLSGDQTVDVTPRRMQQFTITPGSTYQWQNVPLDGDTANQQGTVVAGADGLVTVEGFAVTPEGNWLIIQPAS